MMMDERGKEREKRKKNDARLYVRVTCMNAAFCISPS
jgi:hypothetical protein